LALLPDAGSARGEDAAEVALRKEGV